MKGGCSKHRIERVLGPAKVQRERRAGSACSIRRGIRRKSRLPTFDKICFKLFYSSFQFNLATKRQSCLSIVHGFLSLHQEATLSARLCCFPNKRVVQRLH
jgi:hypothetical protein